MENELHKEPATPEEIWNILRAVSEEQQKASRETEEIKKQIKATSKQLEETCKVIKVAGEQIKETDRQMKETDRRMKETDRRMDKRMKETDQRLKDTDRRLKKLDELFTSQWGKLVESLVEGDLIALLQEQGIKVQTTHPTVKGRRNGEHFEYDILAANGEEVVVVEVKTTLRAGDVTHFLEKLDKFTGWVPEFKGRKVLGAVAYLKVDHSVEVYAERQGLYIIRATGSSASIINEADFQPRVFY